jgi:transposase
MINSIRKEKAKKQREKGLVLELLYLYHAEEVPIQILAKRFKLKWSYVYRKINGTGATAK